MKGDRVEIVIDAGEGARTYEVTATKAGRRVDIANRRGVVEVSEVTRSGTPVRTARFMASRILALVEHPAADQDEPPAAKPPSAPNRPRPGRSHRTAGVIVDPSDFDALSFDCYGTLIDWEAGIAAVLGPWAQSRDLDLTDEALLTAYSGHEARAEAEHPGDLYPLILERSLRDLGAELGAEVTQEDAQRLGRSVPDWPAFGDSHGALTALSGALPAHHLVQRGPGVVRGQ